MLALTGLGALAFFVVVYAATMGPMVAAYFAWTYGVDLFRYSRERYNTRTETGRSAVLETTERAPMAPPLPEHAVVPLALLVDEQRAHGLTAAERDALRLETLRLAREADERARAAAAVPAVEAVPEAPVAAPEPFESLLAPEPVPTRPEAPAKRWDAAIESRSESIDHLPADENPVITSQVSALLGDGYSSRDAIIKLRDSGALVPCQPPANSKKGSKAYTFESVAEFAASIGREFVPADEAKVARDGDFLYPVKTYRLGSIVGYLTEDLEWADEHQDELRKADHDVARKRAKADRDLAIAAGRRLGR